MASINDPGIFHRLPSQEHEDYALANTNILSESRKSWPNDAGFDNLTEYRGPIPLTIKGSIPAFAAGALYRTGPGVSKLEDMPNGVRTTSRTGSMGLRTRTSLTFMSMARGSPRLWTTHREGMGMSTPRG